MSDVPSCIDISHHQGNPDFSRVAADGVLAMIHKATQGTGNVDDCRAENIIAATKAGIACCTYHFLQHGSVEAQMAHYLDVVQPIAGERVVIDWEDWPDGDSYVTAADLVAAVQYLAADVRGFQITVYGSESKLNEELSDLDADDAAVLQQTDLWIAHYGVNAPGTWPREIWPAWSLFQYSENGHVDGIATGAVDLNRYNGADDELLDWMAPAGDPAPEPARSMVAIDITMAGDVDLSVTVNGELIVLTTAA